MAGGLITDEGQVELNGLLMGPGTIYSIGSFNPWTWPDLSAGDVGRPQRHGLIAGQDLMRGRRVPFVVDILGSTPTDVLTAARTLAGAFAPSSVEVPLVWLRGGRTERLYGRPRLADPDSRSIFAGTITVECRFLATDPLIYSNDAESSSVGFPVGASGRTYPRTYPRSYGAVGVGGVVNALNEGTVDAPWQAQIVGPWVNPTVTHLASGKQLALAIALGAGETLSLDSSDESVILDDAHRLNSVLPGSEWPVLEPGENEFRFGGASGTGTATLTWRSAWL